LGAGVPGGRALTRAAVPTKVALWLTRYDVQAMSSAPATASNTGRTDGGTAAVIRTEELTKVYPGTDSPPWTG